MTGVAKKREGFHPCPYALHDVIYRDCPRAVHGFDSEPPCAGCPALARLARLAVREGIGFVRAQVDAERKLYAVFVEVERLTGRPPRVLEVVPEGESTPYAGPIGDVLIHELAWRDVVRGHVTIVEGREPRAWEVEWRMRQDARYMGVPVDVSRLPPLSGRHRVVRRIAALVGLGGSR